MIISIHYKYINWKYSKSGSYLFIYFVYIFNVPLYIFDNYGNVNNSNSFQVGHISLRTSHLRSLSACLAKRHVCLWITEFSRCKTCQCRCSRRCNLSCRTHGATFRPTRSSWTHCGRGCRGDGKTRRNYPPVRSDQLLFVDQDKCRWS